jgi:hypothetical protein
LVIGLKSTGLPHTKKPQELASSCGFAIVAETVFDEKSIATLSRFNG